jgi:hypothetical protein
MRQFIVDFFVSYGLQALVAVVGGALLYFASKAKSEKVRTIREIANKVFLLVEKTIPDDTKNKTAKKIDRALKLFNAMYAETFNDEPPEDIVKFVQKIWEVTAAQNKLLK